MAVARFGMTLEGISEDDLRVAAEQLRPALAQAMKSPMKELKKKLVSGVSGSPIGVRTGKTRAAVRRAKIKTFMKGDQVVGQLSHRGFLMNILEGGATIPARTIRPKPPNQALRFAGGGSKSIADGNIAYLNNDRPAGIKFATEVHLPVRHIKARPVSRPAISAIEPMLRLKLAATVERVIAQGRAAKTGGDDDASE
jgi:hypothetical protein